MDILLDTTTHDLVFAADDLVLIDDETAVAQSVKIRLLTWAGESFLDDTIGMLSFGTFFRKRPLLGKVRETIRREVLATPGVLTVQSVNLDAAEIATKRLLKVSVIGTSAAGPFIVGVTVAPGAG